MARPRYGADKVTASAIWGETRFVTGGREVDMKCIEELHRCHIGDSFNQSACLPVLLRVQYHTYEYSCTQYSL